MLVLHHGGCLHEGAEPDRHFYFSLLLFRHISYSCCLLRFYRNCLFLPLHLFVHIISCLCCCFLPLCCCFAHPRSLSIDFPTINFKERFRGTSFKKIREKITGKGEFLFCTFKQNHQLIFEHLQPSAPAIMWNLILCISCASAEKLGSKLYPKCNFSGILEHLTVLVLPIFFILNFKWSQVSLEHL